MAGPPPPLMSKWRVQKSHEGSSREGERGRCLIERVGGTEGQLLHRVSGEAK